MSGSSNPSPSQPTSSSCSSCTQCGEAKERLLYVLPVPGGKKEFCSESCLTQHRRAQKAARAGQSNGPATPSGEQRPAALGTAAER